MITIILLEDRVDFFALAHFVNSFAVEELSFGRVENFVKRLAAELVHQPQVMLVFLMGQEQAERSDSWVASVGLCEFTIVIVKPLVEFGFSVASLEVVLVILGLGKLLNGYLLLCF